MKEKLGLLLSPDLRKVARQVREADDALRRAQKELPSTLAPVGVRSELDTARSKLADALESLTGRRPPG